MYDVVLGSDFGVFVGEEAVELYTYMRSQLLLHVVTHQLVEVGDAADFLRVQSRVDNVGRLLSVQRVTCARSRLQLYVVFETNAFPT